MWYYISNCQIIGIQLLISLFDVSAVVSHLMSRPTVSHKVKYSAKV